MIFRYSELITATEELEIEDVGNVALIGTDSLQKEYYLIIQTVLGRTSCIKYGPNIPDLPCLLDKCDYNYLQFDYNEGKICKLIDKFLHTETLSKVEIVTIDEIRSRIKNLIDYIGMPE